MNFTFEPLQCICCVIFFSRKINCALFMFKSLETRLAGFLFFFFPWITQTGLQGLISQAFCERLTKKQRSSFGAPRKRTIFFSLNAHIFALHLLDKPTPMLPPLFSSFFQLLGILNFYYEELSVLCARHVSLPIQLDAYEYQRFLEAKRLNWPLRASKKSKFCTLVSISGPQATFGP